MNPELLDYDLLVAEYERNLVTMLRGFRPAVGFLDTWVPDEDLTRSLVALFEAAALAGEDSVTLFLGRNTVDQLDVAQVRKLVSGLGRIETASTEGGILVKFLAATLG